MADIPLFHISSDVPGAPASAKYIEVCATSIKMSWEPPLKDGGAAISNYIVDKRETSRANWAQVCAKIKGNVLEFNVEKLIEGHEYQFRIRAENMWGVGDPHITSPVIAKNPFSESLPAYLLSLFTHIMSVAVANFRIMYYSCKLIQNLKVLTV